MLIHHQVVPLSKQSSVVPEEQLSPLSFILILFYLFIYLLSFVRVDYSIEAFSFLGKVEF